MSLKDFSGFRRCIGATSGALVITSMCRVQFSVARCFRADTCLRRSTPRGSNRADHRATNRTAEGAGAPFQPVTSTGARTSPDPHLLDLGGTYGDPNAGDPVHYDERRIEHDQGDVEIVVYNRAILMFTTDSEAVRAGALQPLRGLRMW